MVAHPKIRFGLPLDNVETLMDEHAIPLMLQFFFRFPRKTSQIYNYIFVTSANVSRIKLVSCSAIPILEDRHPLFARFLKNNNKGFLFVADLFIHFSRALGIDSSPLNLCQFFHIYWTLSSSFAAIMPIQPSPICMFSYYKLVAGAAFCWYAQGTCQSIVWHQVKSERYGHKSLK